MALLDPRQYADGGGLICPNCESDQIEGDSPDIEAGVAMQEMSCNECGASWQDVYYLDRYQELETPEDSARPDGWYNISPQEMPDKLKMVLDTYPNANLLIRIDARGYRDIIITG